MKSRKLRSPIKAIHEALVGIRLAMGNPLCVQPTKTESFRDLLASFNSVYYTPAVSSSSSLSSSVADAGSLCYHLPRQFPAPDDVSAATASTSTACSSSLSSASATAAGRDNPDAAADDQLLPLTAGAINSRRFFFSPCTSKFIAAGETSFLEMGRRSDLSDQEPKELAAEAEAEEEGKVVFFDDVSPPEYSSSSDTTETTLEEILAAAPPEAALWPRQSIPMALASRDPYGDFRSSMDEMVSAHGLRDWPGLQELLHCYLRLNDRKTHKFIVLAFADLLMHLAAEGKIHKSVMHETLICASPLQLASPPHGKSLSCKTSFLSD